MNFYSCTAVDKLISQYYELGGEVYTIEEGVLGHGTLLLYGENLKTIVVKEVGLNEWSSAHTIRCYNKTPKKYEQILETI